MNLEIGHSVEKNLCPLLTENSSQLRDISMDNYLLYIHNYDKQIIFFIDQNYQWKSLDTKVLTNQLQFYKKPPKLLSQRRRERVYVSLNVLYLPGYLLTEQLKIVNSTPIID